MTRARHRLAVLLAVALAAAVPARAQGVDRVAQVVDGNELVLATGERIRLDDSDAPDLAPRCRCRDECATAAAARALAMQLVRDGVRIERYGQDRERRTLARVRTADGRSLAAALIEAGLARPHREGAPRQSWCR